MRVVAGQVEQGLGAAEQSSAEELGFALAAGLDVFWMEDLDRLESRPLPHDVANGSS
jgi:hypothetical protein